MSFEVPAGFKARVRMYCHGFGDCFLLSLRANGEARPFTILIDCGIFLNSPSEKPRMAEVAQSVVETVDSLDLLVVTHEHYDHLSGFIHGQDSWNRLKGRIKRTWFAWTEDPEDRDAQSLQKYKDDALGLVSASLARLNGLDETAERVGALAGLMPAFSQQTQKATEIVASFSQGAERKFLSPGDVMNLGDSGCRAVVLGPPRDRASLQNTLGRAGDTFKSLAEEPGALAKGLHLDLPKKDAPPSSDYADRLKRAFGLEPRDEASPFRSAFHLQPKEDEDRWAAAFPGGSAVKARYEDPRNAWRRIEGQDLAGIESTALQLDSITNNTSLVFAFVLDSETTLLFVGDAQVGNWLSWPAGPFDLGGRYATLDDLLATTRLYKAGHHASHNATVIPDRFERLPKGLVTLVPVEKLGRFPEIPYPKILDALAEKGVYATSEGAGQAGDPFTKGPVSPVTGRPLYLEVLVKGAG